MMSDKEKLEVALSALRDIMNPIRYLQRISGENEFDGPAAIRLSMDSSLYKSIASDALRIIYNS